LHRAIEDGAKAALESLPASADGASYHRHGETMSRIFTDPSHGAGHELVLDRQRLRRAPRNDTRRGNHHALAFDALARESELDELGGAPTHLSPRNHDARERRRHELTLEDV